MKKYFFILLLFLILFSCLSDPISHSNIISPDIYDSLLVVDVSEFDYDFYCYLYMKNEQIVFDEYYYEIKKIKKNMKNYIVIQVKSENTYYINDVINYDYNPFAPDETKQTKIDIIKDSTVFTKKMEIIYIGKLIAKKENGKVKCSFQKDEENYDRILKAIIENYNSHIWKNRSRELMETKKDQGVLL